MLIIIGKKDRLLFNEINIRLKELAELINVDISDNAAELAAKDVKIKVYGQGIINPDETENEADKALAEMLDDEEDYKAISSNQTFFEEDRLSLGRLDDLSS